jgi:thiol:disulfide interchange protein DsbC
MLRFMLLSLRKMTKRNAILHHLMTDDGKTEDGRQKTEDSKVTGGCAAARITVFCHLLIYNRPVLSQEIPMFRLIALIASVILSVSFASAPSAAQSIAANKLRQSVEKRLGTQVDSISKTEYLGLYELYVNGRIYYTDAQMSVFIDGSLIDARNMQNITEARLERLSAIKFSDLPLEQAIKQVRGNGKRQLATFEDPNCGYCKLLARELQKLDNITLYTFLYPLLREDSDRKSRQIWCANDRAKAWNDWMVNDREPANKSNCDTSAIDRNVAFARKLSINATPTLFFADGARVPGAAPIRQIEKKMDALLP